MKGIIAQQVCPERRKFVSCFLGILITKNFKLSPVLHEQMSLHKTALSS